MQLGVNVPNFGPGTNPGVLRRWAQTIEGLGFELLTISDHLAITPDVAKPYPGPFYEPFTTLAWLAGITDRVMLGSTVVIVPYRHPLATARMTANLNDLSGGRLILGVGVGWSQQEFAALDAPFERRGAVTDEYLQTMRSAWADEVDYRGGQVPIWVGGNSDAAIRRAVRFGDAWHPMEFTPTWFRAGVERLNTLATEAGRAVPAVAPRIVLRLSASPVDGPNRRTGEGTIDQIVADIDELRDLGSQWVLLDTYTGDPDETLHPQPAWALLAELAARYGVGATGPERSA